MGDPVEADWKHMRAICDDLRERLCGLINAKAKAIIEEQGTSEYKKYLALYHYIQEADGRVARCFDDWRRSTILVRMIAINREKLFTPEEFAGLTESVRGTIAVLEKL